MKPSVLYIIIVSAVFVGLAGVFLLLPRSTYSELEKRELAEFPEFRLDKLKGAQYTSEVSHWFSDTEPYRDEFMTASMKVRDMLRVSFGDDEDAITFHSTGGDSPATEYNNGIENQADFENNITADENAKIASAGIILVGKAPNVIALNAFGGEATGGKEFAKVASEYAREIPNAKVYVMAIPLASEFYLPEKAKSKSKPQLPFIKNVYGSLTDGAKGVNAYGALASHAEENIYLRTDHHWSPLGAYYAAQEFAKTAGVPFKDLSSYEKRVVHDFVGSMYGYSKDISVKNSPEDFVYYMPKGVKYDVTYRNYTINKDYQVTGEGKPVKGAFFNHYKDGSGGAYSTFMGGDSRLTHVSTDTKNGRRLIVIKDSYGNPVPGYLFYSFEDIYVVDFRYFTHNIKKFAADNKVTDIVFCLNVFNVYSNSSAAKIKKFLTQGENNFAAPTTESDSSKSPAKEQADEKQKDKSQGDSGKGTPGASESGSGAESSVRESPAATPEAHKSSEEQPTTE